MIDDHHTPPKKPRRRLRSRLRPTALIASPLLAVGTLLMLAPSASAFFTPESGGSPNADSIDSLYKIVLYIAIVVFVVVEGALGYALWRFSARKNPVAHQTHGNTRLEIGWTLGAVTIVVALIVITLLKLGAIRNPPNSDPSGAKLVGESGVLYASAEKRLPPNHKALEIEVIGRQFIWQYIYPGAAEKDGLGAPYAYTEMVVPTHTTVLLDIVSDDVVHSWWIPQLGGKFQAVPGYNNYAWFKIDKPGVYRGQCANICGRGHARMIAFVKAVPPAKYEEWIEKRKEELAQANVDAAKARAQLESREGTGKVLNP